uniref:WH2 domain-containing protein n=1 Tax=Emiliania huxleyi TaxID=2903 RepID=A0A7S3W3U3_EMIHU
MTSMDNSLLAQIQRGRELKKTAPPTSPAPALGKIVDTDISHRHGTDDRAATTRPPPGGMFAGGFPTLRKVGGPVSDLRQATEPQKRPLPPPPHPPAPSATAANPRAAPRQPPPLQDILSKPLPPAQPAPPSSAPQRPPPPPTAATTPSGASPPPRPTLPPRPPPPPLPGNVPSLDTLPVRRESSELSALPTERREKPAATAAGTTTRYSLGWPPPSSLPPPPKACRAKKVFPSAALRCGESASAKNRGSRTALSTPPLPPRPGGGPRGDGCGTLSTAEPRAVCPPPPFKAAERSPAKPPPPPPRPQTLPSGAPVSGSRPQPPKPLGSGGGGGGSDDGAGGDDGGGVAGGCGEAGVAPLLSLQAKLGEAKAEPKTRLPHSTLCPRWTMPLPSHPTQAR